MRDLDDPANPYREKYGAWDRWLFANAKNPSMEEMQAFMTGSAPEGYIYLRPSVTAEGWLIPQLEEMAQCSGAAPLSEEEMARIEMVWRSNFGRWTDAAWASV